MLSSFFVSNCRPIATIPKSQPKLIAEDGGSTGSMFLFHRKMSSENREHVRAEVGVLMFKCVTETEALFLVDDTNRSVVF